MSWPLVIVMVVCFGIGAALSFWTARRRMRAHLANRMAREVERELARRVLAGYGHPDAEKYARKSGTPPPPQ
ncbi:LapA family protein [Sinimarinibacterium sp. NLF-5-8]|uniref:LapA family protein n=1 Tax=Sinimarinibacterium sp. NLF-5-8 TaxID=2698684 RepID=UPI00137BF853|nr:LapA family protein [Sinimarinibacterium sp. NLF-5-8]QHS09590.1 LapA family protein [Sinimarinibacterium sp. NLF-5-8]